MIGKTFEKNDLAIALSILYTKEKEVLSAYISKHNSTCEKLILLMITNEEKEGWHYLAVANYQHYYIKKLQNIRVVFIV